MRNIFARGIATTLLLLAMAAHADEPIISGPQVGEKLPSFKMRGVFGDDAGKEMDLVAKADGKPLALVFVHELTRPSLALTRGVMAYAHREAKSGMIAGMIYLADDKTEAENFLKRARNALPEGVAIGVSSDGKEGPGSYGLHRKATLTVLLAKENKVTANFALVQPSLAADAPKILAEMAKLLGHEKAPSLAQLGLNQVPRAVGGEAGMADLRSLLRPVLEKSAEKGQVDKAAAAVDEAAAKDAALKAAVGQSARRIVESGKLADYGTAAAQEHLRRWAREYGGEEKKTPRKE